MATYAAQVDWTLADGEDFAANRYSRGHQLAFDGGISVAATASPHVVGPKWSVAGAVDPEEMLVASLASCHMLSFLHVAREAGFVARAYRDRAEGVMSKNPAGKLFVSAVTLRPAIEWDGAAPDTATLDHLHHRAHEECFIANSVRTEITVKPPL